MFYRIFGPLRRGIVVVPLLAIGFLIGGCGGAQESVAGSFVGVIPYTGSGPANTSPETADKFVSVIAAEPEEGEDQQEVRAYLCDGFDLNEWFWEGSATGNEFELSSDSGARLTGTLTADGVNGTITMEDGESISFEAPRATGIAGLYDVTTTADGEVIGTSDTGAQLEGQIAEEADPDGRYPITGTITSPDGEEFDLFTEATIAEPGEWRVIISPDGYIKGAKRTAPAKGGGSGAGFFDLLVPF